MFLLLSLLALAGMATANVLLPSLVKLHFPDRVGLMTSIYTTSLAVGLTLASVLTVPIVGRTSARGAGGCSPGRSPRWSRRSPGSAWSGTTGTPSAAARGISLGAVARTRLGWGMALFFGFQSLQAYSVFGWFAQVYRDAGFSAGTAGLLLGVITAMSIPLSFWLPAWAARMEHQTWLIVGAGRLLPDRVRRPDRRAGRRAPGCGRCSSASRASVFPVVLTLIGLRARTSEGTAALSGFTQSVGYLIAAIGPFGMGLALRPDRRLDRAADRR